MPASESIPAEIGSFDRGIGLVYTEISPDGARASLELTPQLHQPAGIVHGGVYCSIIESVASVSAHTWLNRDGGDAAGTVVGVNNNTDFLRALSSGTVVAAATPIHRGRRQQLWLVTITDADQRMIARGQVRLQNLPAE
ncbi:PaaI family thioesterase [[Mycobacterium] crassicus]|uniref:PaaI family thioesterase n=1 Tax=[Mycobacterium] crassicus TaxID=2872309 RepID=A0ABU5XQ37_9MYCO|nr:PaaI family thioesterase [Mycolicibacter sp. MYC098]MEB3023892.1 PaaI family thioesterase [Mycolicibacter sp. MYC098]